MKKHYNIKIYGKVQGVFFRVSAKAEAEKLGIFGFAKNEEDGTVYIEAEGEKEKLDKFLEWCRKGPEAALVEKLEITGCTLKNFADFSRDFTDF